MSCIQPVKNCSSQITNMQFPRWRWCKPHTNIFPQSIRIFWFRDTDKSVDRFKQASRQFRIGWLKFGICRDLPLTVDLPDGISAKIEAVQVTDFEPET